MQLAQTSAGLEVTFDGNATDTGRPVRSPKPTLLLVREQIATVRFNGRFAGHDEAWYEDKIVHVAFDFVPRRDLFLSTPVTFVVDARADLW